MIINLKTIKKVYINLKEQTLKRKQTEKLFKNLGYTNVERFEAIRDNSYYSSGCSLSHKAVLEKYFTESPLAIFEDDINICDWYNDYVLDNIIEIPDDCDIFYMGYSIAEGEQQSGPRPLSFSLLNEKIIKLNSSLSAHSIIFCTNKAKEIAINSINQSISNKIPGDVAYYDNFKKLNVYSFKSALFYQRGFYHIFTNTRLYNNGKNYFSVYSELNKNKSIWSDYLREIK